LLDAIFPGYPANFCRILAVNTELCGLRACSSDCSTKCGEEIITRQEALVRIIRSRR
jgi:hypothetical protein